VPFTGGFLAKFYVINAAVAGDDHVLGLIAMVSAVIAAYLYLRIVVAMYFDGGGDDTTAAPVAGRLRIPAPAGVALGVAVVGVLWMGILPGVATDLANDAVAQLVAFSR